MATYNATADLNFTLRATYSKTAGIATASESPSINVTKSFSNTDVTFVFQNTYATTGTVTIDLTSLTDDYGRSLALANLKFMAINNTGSANLLVGGGANPALGTEQRRVNGGVLDMNYNTYVIGGSAKNIQILTTGSAAYSVLLAGN